MKIFNYGNPGGGVLGMANSESCQSDLTPPILMPGTRVTLLPSQTEPKFRGQMVTLTLKEVTGDNEGLWL